MTQAAPAMAMSRSLLGWVDIAAWLAFIAAWLYIAGWSFAYHYFDRFHLGLLALEIPREEYWLYSFWVLQDHWGQVAVLYLSGMVYLVLRRYIAGVAWRQWETLLINVLAPVLGLLLVWYGYQLGGTSANKRFTAQQQQDYPAYSRVQVWLTESDKSQGRRPGMPQPTPPFPIHLDDGCYRLFVQHRDKVFVFKPVPEAPSANLSLLTLPLEQIRVLRVLPNNVSCRG